MLIAKKPIGGMPIEVPYRIYKTIDNYLYGKMEDSKASGKEDRWHNKLLTRLYKGRIAKSAVSADAALGAKM